MTDHDNRDPLSDALRDSLRRRAAEAPAGDYLAERIITNAEQSPGGAPRSGNRGWRTWTLPLIAAGAVAGVVAAVVGIENFRPAASHNQPGTDGPSIVQTEQSTAVQSTPSTPPTTPSDTPSALTNVQIADLTFVGDNDGWALGSADCVSGPGRCTAMWRTTDGHNWTSMPGAEFNVPGVRNCADPCVQNIRFANDDVGYAFGPSSFWITHDGGRSWDEQPGGAIQLETLDGNVIRVSAGTPSGCPGPCDVRVEISDVGSMAWTETLGSLWGINFALARTGSDAYLLATKNPAGGGGAANSTLYRSADDGGSWTISGEPCPQRNGEVDSYAVATSPGGVSVLCANRMDQTRLRVATSTDGGVTFNDRGTIPGVPSLLTGNPSTVLVAAGNGMARSTDGGQTWQPITDVSGQIGWVGFESPTVGRAVSADGTTIWTTRDGGATWRAASIG